MSLQSKFNLNTITGSAPMVVLLAAVAAPTATVLTSRFISAPLSTVSNYHFSTHVYETSTAINAGIKDLLNSTAVYALLKLDGLAKDYPRLTAYIDDARTFARMLPIDLVKPDIWTDGESEVAFEWKDASRHAIVSFEGNNSFGYALRRGNRFVPGAFPGTLDASMPRDLVNYLRDNSST